MSTYLHCYEMMNQIRFSLNDHSDAKVQGTDTTGAFQNEEILFQINAEQTFLQAVVRRQFPELFYKSATLTGAASVYTIPADCWKIKILENAEGQHLTQIDLNEKHVGTGSDSQYYRYGNVLRVDADDVTDPLTLWYESRCRDLDFGTATAGGVLYLTLAATARPVVDYYNGMVMENVTASWVDTIDDYSAARVCAITETGAVSQYYGLVSELPEPFHNLILTGALIRMKSHPNSPEKPTAEELAFYRDGTASALSSFGNTELDINSIINDFG